MAEKVGDELVVWHAVHLYNRQIKLPKSPVLNYQNFCNGNILPNHQT